MTWSTFNKRRCRRMDLSTQNRPSKVEGLQFVCEHIFMESLNPNIIILSWIRYGKHTYVVQRSIQFLRVIAQLSCVKIHIFHEFLSQNLIISPWIKYGKVIHMFSRGIYSFWEWSRRKASKAAQLSCVFTHISGISQPKPYHFASNKLWRGHTYVP